MIVSATPSFNKDIGKIKDGQLATRIERLIKRMQSVNSISEIAGVKKLAGSTNAYRVRIAD